MNAALPFLFLAKIGPENGFDFGADFFSTMAGQFLTIVFWMAVVPGFAGGALFAFYYLLSLPLRREQRARLFLDILETGLKNGQSPEHAIIAVSQTREPSVGVRFHLLAAWLERGLRLPEALEKVSGLLPPNVAATLRVGVELGDLARVLPACRALLGDGVSRVRKAHSYVFTLLFSSSTKIIGVCGVLLVFVVPKFEEIFKDLVEGAPLPKNFIFLAESRSWIALVLILISVLMWLGAVFYIAGPRLTAAVGGVFPRLGAWLSTASPWQRKRLQRDFTSLLAVFLDAGIPEERAVTLAAEGTANRVMRDRAARVAARLREGEKLTDAIRHMDDTGEFRWRLANAARGKIGFRATLGTWIEALDSKAFQQEQSAATVVTSCIVLFNGLVIGLIAVAMFQMLLGVLDTALLW
ncbi:MAG: type II secretion system F family protein [Verrucomicrobia bacterium]|nr:type II secretion system F family protein [Verrucomicrobiota bacterium]